MVVIRLSRAGTKKKPFYHLAVADKQSPRDGRFIERVGFYNPVARGKSEPLRVNLERIDYWLSVGAQLSPKVKSIVARARILDALPPETDAMDSDVSSSVDEKDALATKPKEDDKLDATEETLESKDASGSEEAVADETGSSDVESAEEVVVKGTDESDSVDATSDTQSSEESTGSDDEVEEVESQVESATVDDSAETTHEVEATAAETAVKTHTGDSPQEEVASTESTASSTVAQEEELVDQEEVVEPEATAQSTEVDANEDVPANSAESLHTEVSEDSLEDKEKSS